MQWDTTLLNQVFQILDKSIDLTLNYADQEEADELLDTYATCCITFSFLYT